MLLWDYVTSWGLVTLFGDCVVGTLSAGTLTEAHIIDCEEKT